LLGFHISKKDPVVTPLPVHLPESTAYKQYQQQAPVDSCSLLEHNFHQPLGVFHTDKGLCMFD